MADWDVKLDGFKELEAQLQSIQSGEVADRIQRDALRAAGNVIKAELTATTPVRTDPVHGQSLPAGALKAAIRTTIKLPKNGEAASATVHFGNLTHIARFVDSGHANPTAKRGLKHTPAHPFIRAAEEASREAAADAYLTTMQAEINEVIDK